MCNLFSGHVVRRAGKDWGKVLIKTGIHHEKDREFPDVSKYGEDLLAWETIKKADINSGIKIVHACGKPIKDEEKGALIELVEKELKKIGTSELIRIVAKREKTLYLDDTLVSEIPERLDCESLSLSLSGTKVSKIPANIKVKKLFLDNTPVSEIPEGLECEILSLSGTKVSKIPANLKVAALHLNNTLVTEIPEGIDCEVLSLNDTTVSEIPASLSVKKLYLDNTLVTEIPEGIDCEVLSLNDTTVSEIPANIKVEVLWINDTPVSEIPKGFKGRVYL